MNLWMEAGQLCLEQDESMDPKKKKNYNNKERVLIHLQVGDRQTEGLDAL